MDKQRRLMKDQAIRALRSEAGTAILTWLDDQYAEEDVTTNDTHETYYRLGQRRVVIEMMRLSIERTTDE